MVAELLDDRGDACWRAGGVSEGGGVVEDVPWSTRKAGRSRPE